MKRLGNTIMTYTGYFLLMYFYKHVFIELSLFQVFGIFGI